MIKEELIAKASLLLAQAGDIRVYIGFRDIGFI